MFASFGTSSSCGTIILLSPRCTYDFIHPSFDYEGRIISGVLDGPLGSIMLCAAYAPNDPKSRKRFFSNLSSHLTGNILIILTGDFNCVIDIDIDMDRRGSVSTLCGIGVTELLQLISDFSLIDCWRVLHPSDISFTWRNASNTVSRRLDRFYVSSSLDVVSCQHSPCHFSDHDSVL